VELNLNVNVSGLEGILERHLDIQSGWLRVSCRATVRYKIESLTGNCRGNFGCRFGVPERELCVDSWI